MMIARPAQLQQIRTAIGRSPITVLTGPRQAGKTTLARQLVSEDSPAYFDLEDTVSLARLDETRTALEPRTLRAEVSGALRRCESPDWTTWRESTSGCPQLRAKKITQGYRKGGGRKSSVWLERRQDPSLGGNPGVEAMRPGETTPPTATASARPPRAA